MNSEKFAKALKKMVLKDLNSKHVSWTESNGSEILKRPRRGTPHPKVTKKMKTSTSTPKILSFDDSEDEADYTFTNSGDISILCKPKIKGTKRKRNSLTSEWTVTKCEEIKPDTSNRSCTELNATLSASSEDETMVERKYNYIPVAGGLSDEESDENIEEIFSPKVSLNLKKCKIIRPKIDHPEKLEVKDLPPVESPEKSNDSIESAINEIVLPPVESPKIRFSRLVKTFINEKGCILFVKHPLKFYFHGKLSLSVFYGAVEILGHTLHHNLKEFEVYSPRGHAYLCFETKETNLKNKETLQKSLQDFKVPTKQIKEYLYRLKENDCVLAFKNLNNNLTNYLSTHVAQYLFPKPIQCEKRVEKKLHCLFELNEPTWKTFRKNENWSSCVENSLYYLATGFSCSMLCGGKSVGKSTLLRYMVNALLNQVEKVVCIDLDIGQPEFTIGGCVSVTIIDQPIFGPNFTYLKTPVKSFFVGDVNVLNCMDRYLASAKELIDYCNSNIDKKYPWIVNCMGFSKSLGTDLTVSLIKLICPTTVIQINSRMKSRNYLEDLDCDYVENYIYSFPIIVPETKVKHNLITLESVSEDKIDGEFEFEPRHLREMSILAYFSQIIEEGKEITSVAPYSVKLSSIKLRDLSYSKQNILAVLNGNLVALCHENNETSDTFNCLGFGIVRGIDRDSEELFLLTPIPEIELEKVNSLIRGFINLPPSLYMTTGRQGLVPYILLGTQQGTSAIPKRSYRNLKTLFKKK